VTPVETFDSEGRLKRSDVTPALFMRHVDIPAEETRANAAYGLLTTPDRVEDVVVPEDALLIVGYQAMWRESVAGAASAALFIGANQLKLGLATAGPVVNQTATIGAATPADTYSLLASSPGGLRSNQGIGGAAYAGDVATGQILGGGLDIQQSDASQYDGAYGFCVINNIPPAPTTSA